MGLVLGQGSYNYMMHYSIRIALLPVGQLNGAVTNTNISSEIFSKPTEIPSLGADELLSPVFERPVIIDGYFTCGPSLPMYMDSNARTTGCFMNKSKPNYFSLDTCWLSGSYYFEGTFRFGTLPFSMLDLYLHIISCNRPKNLIVATISRAFFPCLGQLRFRFIRRSQTQFSLSNEKRCISGGLSVSYTLFSQIFQTKNGRTENQYLVDRCRGDWL